MPSIGMAEYGIMDVWVTNMEEEFRKIRQVIQHYKYVAMVSCSRVEQHLDINLKECIVLFHFINCLT